MPVMSMVVSWLWLTLNQKLEALILTKPSLKKNFITLVVLGMFIIDAGASFLYHVYASRVPFEKFQVGVRLMSVSKIKFFDLLLRILAI